MSLTNDLIDPEVPATEGLRELVTKGLRHRLFGQAREMVALQVVTKLLSVFASAWAIRCLGPEKLGISGLIGATAMQVCLVAGMNLDILLTRRFKDNHNLDQQQTLMDLVYTMRSSLTMIAVIIGLPLALWLWPSSWWLGIAAVVPVFIFSLNQPYWILSGRENLAANSRAAAAISLVTSICYLLFFRPGQMTGSDILVQATATGVGWMISWRLALQGMRRPRFVWSRLPEAIPLAWEGRWLFLTGMVCYVYTALDGPLLGYLHSLHELGLARPAGQLVSTFNQFFAMVPLLLYPRLIEWNKVSPQFMWARQKKLGLLLAFVAVPVSLGAFLLAPLVFRLLYGPAFLPSAYPFAILLTSKLVVLVGGLFGMGIWAKGEDKLFLRIMSFVAVISLTLNLIFIPHFGLLASTLVNLTSECLIFILTFIACQRLARMGRAI